MKSNDENNIRSIDRAITILEALAEEENGCGVTTLSKMTLLHQTTVFRILSTLMSRGYVEKDTNTNNYRLGVRILHLESAVLNRMDVRKIARPYIRELSDKTQEVVHLAILDQDEAVYIDKVENPERSIRIYSQVGRRIPLHCTGLGKVLLSGLDDLEIAEIIKKKGMQKYTEYTITDFEMLKKDIDMIRLRGYGFDELEHELGIRCVAAPIFNRKMKLVAAISVTGPTIYISDERMAVLTDEIQKTAKEISNQLGFLE